MWHVGALTIYGLSLGTERPPSGLCFPSFRDLGGFCWEMEEEEVGKRWGQHEVPGLMLEYSRDFSSKSTDSEGCSETCPSGVRLGRGS